MSIDEPPTEPEEPAPRASFWQRRLVGPLKALLTQGVTPDKLAATLGVCAVCSMFPFIGTTSVLNLVVGLRLRMNQPLMQTLNQLLGPVHLAMILVYVKLGEWLWRADDTQRLDLIEMIRAFDELSIGVFLERFGRAGVHAFTAWALTAPMLGAAVYYGTRPVLRRLAQRRSA